MENLILRRIAELSGHKIEFKCEAILTGTAWIGDMPIDITVCGGHVKLNGIGAFSGDSLKLSKSKWRGKGRFKELRPHINQTLIEFGFKPELYLTPLSPVWKRNYNLVEDERGNWKITL